jgi:hypothetical protein
MPEPLSKMPRTRAEEFVLLSSTDGNVALADVCTTRNSEVSDVPPACKLMTELVTPVAFIENM